MKPQKSFTLTLAFDTSVLTCQDEVQLTLTGFTGSSASGDQFQDQPTLPTVQLFTLKTVKYSCTDDVACNGEAEDVSPAPLMTAHRYENKDGSACLLTQVFGTVDPINKKVSLTSGANQPNALFEATVSWPAELVNSSTGMPLATKVSWEIDANGNPINFANGRACIGGIPGSLGTLTADLGGLATNTTVQVSGVTITTFPTPIVIDGERMNVIAQPTASTLTVTRGAGFTTITPHSMFYSGGSTPKKVMSTPFPLDASGKVMLVCIADEAFESKPAIECSPTTPAQACVQVVTRVLGDLYVSRQP